LDAIDDFMDWCGHWLPRIAVVIGGLIVLWFVIMLLTWIHSGWAEWHDNHRERIAEATSFQSESMAETQYKELSAKFRMMRKDTEHAIRAECYSKAVRFMEENKARAQGSLANNKIIVEQAKRELDLCLR
jgi:hypothetical protein